MEGSSSAVSKPILQFSIHVAACFWSTRFAHLCTAPNSNVTLKLIIFSLKIWRMFVKIVQNCEHFGQMLADLFKCRQSFTNCLQSIVWFSNLFSSEQLYFLIILGFLICWYVDIFYNGLWNGLKSPRIQARKRCRRTRHSPRTLRRAAGEGRAKAVAEIPDKLGSMGHLRNCWTSGIAAVTRL